MQHLVAAGQQVDDESGLEVLEKIQLGHGELALGAAGISGDKDEIAGLGSGGRPLEVVVEVHGLAVLIDAEVGDVEVVARILEVIAVAAEERHLRLRSKDDAHVGVLFVLVQVVHSAGIEGYDVAAEATLFGAVLSRADIFSRCAWATSASLMPGLAASALRRSRLLCQPGR